MMIESIQEAIWRLSFSVGQSPYTVVEFEIGKDFSKGLGNIYKQDYDSAIVFFIWKDYSLEDYKDNVVHSKEYLLNESQVQRCDFLHHQVLKYGSPEKLLQWQYNQLFFALGITLSQLRILEVPHQQVEPFNIGQFISSFNVKGAVLAEVILIKNDQ